MKFSELKKICKAMFYLIDAVDAEGNTRQECISLFETVDAPMKLAKYDDADLISCKPRRVTYGDDVVNAMEVCVRV